MDPVIFHKTYLQEELLGRDRREGLMKLMEDKFGYKVVAHAESPQMLHVLREGVHHGYDTHLLLNQYKDLFDELPDKYSRPNWGEAPPAGYEKLFKHYSATSNGRRPMSTSANMPRMGGRRRRSRAA